MGSTIHAELNSKMYSIYTCAVKFVYIYIYVIYVSDKKEICIYTYTLPLWDYMIYGHVFKQSKTILHYLILSAFPNAGLLYSTFFTLPQPATSPRTLFCFILIPRVWDTPRIGLATSTITWWSSLEAFPRPSSSIPSPRCTKEFQRLHQGRHHIEFA